MKRLFIVFGLIMSMMGSAEAAPSERQLENGKKAFSHCANCHTLNPEVPLKMGPHLHGVIGREIASDPSYQYSEALASKRGIWSEKELSRFLVRPSHVVQGTKMHYRGMMSPHAREDLIVYLKFASTQDPSSIVIDDIAARVDNGDIYRGALLAERCLACHTVSHDGKHGIGPNLIGIIGRKAASAPGFDYSERLMKRDIIWDPEQLNMFIFEIKKFDQGSHAAFYNLRRLKDRADIIAWLYTLK